VFSRPAYLAAGVAITLASALLLAWSGEALTVFPEGLYLSADPLALGGLVLASILLGLSIPLHWFAWRRAAQTAAAQGVGALGALLSLGSLSCCAPLLLPGILGLVGFSGTSLLAVNLRLHEFRLALTAIAIAFLGFSFLMATRTVARACRLPGRTVAGERPARSAGA